MIVLGLLLSLITGYDRGIGTFPYILLSSGFCMMLMSAIYWLVELKGVASKLLEDFGKSTLLIFTLNYPVLILALLLKINNSFKNWEAALISLILIALLATISTVYVRFKGR